MAATDSREPARPEPRRDLVDGAWALFSSPRLLAGLAVAVAIACAAGAALEPEGETALPSGGWRAMYLALELQDIFHSWLFTLLLAALALAVVAHGIERLPPLGRGSRGTEARLGEALARRLGKVKGLAAGADPGAEVARVAAAFRARGYRPEVVLEGTTAYLFAERGRSSRFGAWAAHAAALVMLGGAVAGGLWGYSGALEIREGEPFDSVALTAASGEVYRRRLPFVARVNRLDVEQDAAGAPGRLRCNLSLLGPDGREVRRQDLGPGRPLAEAGFFVRQVKYREQPGAERARLALVDRSSGERQEAVLSRGEPLEAGGIVYSVESYAPKFGDLGPAVQMRRTQDGRHTEFWVFQERPDFDAANRPDRYGLEFRGLEKSRAATLRVTRQPGAMAVLVGGALLMAALAVAFHTVYWRLWARVEPGRLTLAGSSDRPSARFERMLADLERELASPAKG